jgi:hypothetical protein
MIYYFCVDICDLAENGVVLQFSNFLLTDIATYLSFHFGKTIYSLYYFSS